MEVFARNNVTVLGDEGPTLVLSHGFGCDQNMWRPLVERLRTRYRLVLFDHVGCGGADPLAWDAAKYSSLQGFADDVVDLMDALEADVLDAPGVTFVGHSVSAMIGVLAANAKPASFDALVLVTPSPRYVDDDDYRGGFSSADIDELLESLHSNYLGWSQTMAPAVAGIDRPDLQRDWVATFCRNDPAHSEVFARATFLADNRADLPRVTVPTLIIESAQDAIAPREVGAYVHAHVPGSRLVTLDSVGHSPHTSHPDATAAAILDFLDTR